MIKIEKLTLTYHGSEVPALVDINLDIKKGEFILISGPTGCGKSTLLNCINGIMFHESSALIKGSITIHDIDIQHLSLAQICQRTGTVFQNPDSQICTAQVESEIAFGLENQQISPCEIEERISQSIAMTGLENCRYQSTESLSGGQKQRLMIACALALRPEILLLDEPISQLDPMGTQEILQVIHNLKRKKLLTVVMVEHRIEDTIRLADQLLVMQHGKIVQKSSRQDAVRDLSLVRNLGLDIPQLPDLFERLRRPERPMEVSEAPLLEINPKRRPLFKTSTGDLICRIRNLSYSYSKKNKPTIQHLNLSFKKNEIVALMGTNGSGKSTLLHLLARRLKPVSGSIQWEYDPSPSIGLLLQATDLMLFCNSVEEEIAFAPVHQKKHLDDIKGIVDSILSKMDLQHLRKQAPFSLSRGQRLRTALASIIAMSPSILLLDEPTTGQDKMQVTRIMEAVNTQFDLVVFCTHDVDTAARYADRVVLMENGQLKADGNPRDIFFNESILSSTSIRQSSIQQYSKRLGIHSLTVDGIFMELNR